MLSRRIATGLGLAAVVLAVILYAPAFALAALLGLFAVLGLGEWAALCGFCGGARMAYVGVCLLAIVALWATPGASAAALIAAGAFWALATAFALTYPAGAAAARRPAALALAGAIAFAGAWHGLMTLREIAQGRAAAPPYAGEWLVVWLIFVTCAADTGAYFVGRACGRHRLAPRVSPGKTWEGFAGGALVGATAGAALAWALGWRPVGEWLALAFAAAFVAAVGDLFESAVKRARGVKDSGALLPGHGGVLDRIDSILATAPAFALWALAFMV